MHIVDSYINIKRLTVIFDNSKSIYPYQTPKLVFSYIKRMKIHFPS